MQCFKYKQRRLISGKLKLSRVWIGQLRLPTWTKPQRRSLQTSDSRVADQRLEAWRILEERSAAGLLPRASEVVAAEKPLVQHAEEWAADRKAAGRRHTYFPKVKAKMVRAFGWLGWSRVNDACVDDVVLWRSSFERSARTRRHYEDALLVLFRWMKAAGRIAANPLEGLSRTDIRGQASRRRRALSDDEARKLVSVAGPRGLFYALLLGTGLRYSEARRLRWADLCVDVAPFWFRVLASSSKNRREETRSLRRELAEALKAIRPSGATPGDVVFRKGTPSRHSLNRDLKRAGIAKMDASGRTVDFHALRHTFVTNLHRSGVLPAAAMHLARHSDPLLTLHTYADAKAIESADDVEGLPSVLPARTQGRTQAGDVSCRVRSESGEQSRQDENENSPRKKASSRRVSRSVGSGRNTNREWSRGELNPRAVTVRWSPLRV